MEFRRIILIRIVIALGVSMIIAWGTVFYAFGVLASPMIAETGMSRSFVYACFSGALIASGLIAPAVGRLVDRIGGRRVMTMGSFIAAAGFLIIAWSPNTIVFAIGWIALGCAIPFTLYDPAFATITAFAGSPRARSLIVQITLFGGFASTMFWPLTHWLDMQIGWRATWLVFAGANLLICAPLHFFVLPKQGETSGEAGAHASTSIDEPTPIATEHRALAFGLMALLFASNNFMLSGMSAHMMPLLSDLGVTPADAVALGALIGPAQVAGRLIELVFGRSISPVLVGWLATLLLVFSLGLTLIIGVAGWAGVAFAIGYGAANGLITISRGTLPLVLFGRVGYGSVLGRLARPSLATAAIAPFVFALLIEAFQARAGLLISIAAAAISLLAITLIAIRFGVRAR